MHTKEAHRKNRKGYQHFKLVSDGGHYLAAEGDGVAKCFDSIQRRGGCISEAQLSRLQALMGTGSFSTLPANDQFLFSLPLEHASELDKGIIPKSLQEEFKRIGMPLTDTARLTVIHVGKIWLLTDMEKKYSIRMLPNNLMVYTELK